MILLGSVNREKYSPKGILGVYPLENQSNIIFKIEKMEKNNPTTYKLEDIESNQIKGGVYIEELQKVKHPDIFLIEKIIKRKRNKLYVKWLGLNNKHNSSISKSQIV